SGLSREELLGDECSYDRDASPDQTEFREFLERWRSYLKGRSRMTETNSLPALICCRREVSNSGSSRGERGQPDAIAAQLANNRFLQSRLLAQPRLLVRHLLPVFP